MNMKATTLRKKIKLQIWSNHSHGTAVKLSWPLNKEEKEVAREGKEGDLKE